ncbi:hypothetical protein [Flagellimonas sp. 2504JD4-2]
MKLINKIYSKINLAFLAVVIVAGASFTSCEDDDKNNLNDFLRNGGFVRFAEVNPPVVVGVSDVSDVTYSFNLIDGNGTATLYDLDLYASLSGTVTDTVNVQDITSFPASLAFNAEDLASLLGVTVADLNFGDQFFFTAKVTNNEGNVFSGSTRLDLIEVTLENGVYLDADGDEVTVGPEDRINSAPDGSLYVARGGSVTDDLLDEAGYLQAFEFNFTIACPALSDTSSFAGTYDVVSHTYSGFGFPTETGIQIVSGPASNQLTVVGGIYTALGSDDLILDVDLSTGTTSIANESNGVAAWNAFGFNAVYSGAGGTGLSLECLDPQQVAFNLETDCCISNNVVMVKQ